MNHNSDYSTDATAPVLRNRLAKISVLGVLGATLLIATACGTTTSGDGSPGPRLPIPGQPAGRAPAEPAGHPGGRVEPPASGGEHGSAIKLSTNGTCSVTGDLEGKFTDSSQMGDYLTCVLPAVEKWIDATYSGMSHPAGYYLVPAGVTGTDIDCDYVDTDLEYCVEAQTVYLGEKAVWKQYSEKGDAAPVLIVAHEVTHHFQHVAQMTEAKVPNEQIRYENQADCGAGAFMNYARQQGWLNAEDDIKDLAGSLQAAGEADRNPKSSHGTIQERLSAFDQGYLSTSPHPLSACIPFVPETPIISG